MGLKDLRHFFLSQCFLFLLGEFTLLQYSFLSSLKTFLSSFVRPASCPYVCVLIDLYLSFCSVSEVFVLKPLISMEVSSADLGCLKAEMLFFCNASTMDSA